MKNLALMICATSLCSIANSQAPTEKSLLWMISGNGISAPSYIYGTFHLLCADDFFVNNVIKEKFNTTKQLYLELDLNDPEAQVKMTKHMLMENDQTLSSFISEEDMQTASDLFQQITGIPLSLFNKTKPMVTSMMLYTSMLGCNPEGWEKEFQSMADEKDIPLKGLETIEYQMGILDSIPYDAQAKSLLNSLLQFDSLKIQNQSLVELYKQMNIDSLYHLAVSEDSIRGYEDIMVTQRNENWVPIITEQVKIMPTFIAVGAGHLGGENGLICLLRKQGFTLTLVYY